MHWFQAFTLGLCVLAVPGWALPLRAFWRRREEPMLRVRSPGLTLGFNALGWLFSQTAMMRYVVGFYRWPCGVTLWVNFFTVVLGSVLISLRTLSWFRRGVYAADLVRVYEGAIAKARKDHARQRRGLHDRAWASPSGSAAPSSGGTPPAAAAPRPGSGMESPGGLSVWFGTAPALGGSGGGVLSSSASEESLRGRAVMSERVPMQEARRWLEPAFLTRVAALVTAALLLPIVVMTFNHSDQLATAQPNCIPTRFIFVMSAYLLALVAVSLLLSRRLNTLVEHFQLRRELSLIGISCAVTVALTVPFQFGAMRRLDQDYPLSIHVTSALPLMLLLCTVVRPLRLAALERRVRVTGGGAGSPGGSGEAGHGDLSTLGLVLRNREALEVFRLFASREYSVENLLLWEEIERFRRGIKRGAVAMSRRKFLRYATRRARGIYDDYINEAAPMEANLPAPARKLTQAAVLRLEKLARRDGSCSSATPGQLAELETTRGGRGRAPAPGPGGAGGTLGGDRLEDTDDLREDQRHVLESERLDLRKLSLIAKPGTSVAMNTLRASASANPSSRASADASGAAAAASDSSPPSTLVSPLPAALSLPASGPACSGGVRLPTLSPGRSREVSVSSTGSPAPGSVVLAGGLLRPSSSFAASPVPVPPPARPASLKGDSVNGTLDESAVLRGSPVHHSRTSRTVSASTAAAAAAAAGARLAPPEDSRAAAAALDADEIAALFDEAQACVFRLMATDTFTRFLLSDEYDELTKRAASSDAHRLVLERLTHDPA